MLHDPGSQMMDMLLAALSAGKLCVIDVSQMRGTAALVLSGLHPPADLRPQPGGVHQGQPETRFPTIAVVEEAQSVLGGG